MEAEVSQTINSLGGTIVLRPDDPHRVIRGFTWDSREVIEDGMFLALPGEHVDGNDFVRDAAVSGAALAVMTRMPDSQLLAIAGEFDCAVAKVDDPYLALRKLAAEYRDSISATVVGVTGSSGKTTTKDLIASVLSQAMSTAATRANYNNEIGVPATLLSANRNTKALVVEMGMRGLGQIEDLCTFVKPRIGVVTNIGVSHLELLGSQDNIARAKAELLASLPADGVAIVNGDDPMTPAVLRHADLGPDVTVLRFGLSTECNVRAIDLHLSDDGHPSFDLMLPNHTYGHVKLRLQGVHNVSNALAAAAVGYSFGLPASTIAEGLILAQPPSMRFQTSYTHRGALIIDDAYNANPDSMRAALSTLQQMDVAGRRIAVLGDMGELGENSQMFHRQLGVCAARSDLDLLICVGALAGDIAESAVEAGMPEENVKLFPDRASVIEYLSPSLAKGDVVLVKASHAMRFDLIVKGLVD